MYIAIINIHGLVRSNNIEMGRDADTGGQTRYVIDLVKELSTREDVEVDLFTRKIGDKRLSNDYNKAIEQIADNARIVRLPCGGVKYIRKERLWPHLDEYVDNLIEFFRSEKRVPDIIHGHYSDGGYVATEIASYFHTPLVFTGHSLGRNKFEYLKSIGLSEERIEDYYTMSTRIAHEERTIRKADMVITSTNYEREELYSSYENRVLDRFVVIPPGLDLEKFFPYYHYEIQDPSITEEQKLAQFNMMKELQRFFTVPEKPLIMALCRPEARKNIDVLIDIYGKNKDLQAIANLAIFAGIRDDINSMEEGEKQVLTDMLLLMDRYDLYGKMAIPKHHNPERDVPELYRIAAMKRGVFVSAAALENFGLTFIEASAVGLPFIGTDKGGVQDIRKNCDSGVLVDITNEKAIHDSIHKILTDADLWDKLSRHGVERIREVYNWKAHCDTYLEHLGRVLTEHRNKKTPDARYERSMAKRMSTLKYLLVSDIDNTLTGDDKAIEDLKKLLEEYHETVGFGIATGRSVDSAKEILEQHGFPKPDVLITSVGSEVYYGENLIADKGWSHYIRRRWHPERIREALDRIEGLELQPQEDTQRAFKVSYNVKNPDSIEDLMEEIRRALESTKSSWHIVLSHNRYLDILPYRASKGTAVKYIAWKWHIDLKSVITAGDSGNDADMLIKPLKGIVVNNHEESLETLRKQKHIYFAEHSYAGGVIEGLRKFKVFPS
ncbi:HAD-IIB family hydrolase [Pleomorphochaeta sp. DL1XJH-081]|jgi:sucrose-phosphate synthase|uniref:HAD-IIB family hydrolase n=1 Tax=Pleomorphochaeta sp. DL1XJH-081 TaxID=3409690 RepID=UPI003BB6C9B2